MIGENFNWNYCDYYVYLLLYILIEHENYTPIHHTESYKFALLLCRAFCWFVKCAKNTALLNIT